MSRRHQINFPQRRRRRWTWLLAILIVAVLAAGSVLADDIGIGSSPDPTAEIASDPSAPPVAYTSAPAPPSTDGTDIAGETVAQVLDDPTATTSPAPTPAPTQNVEPTQASEPTAAPTVPDVAEGLAVGGGIPNELPIVAADGSGDFVAADQANLSAGVAPPATDTTITAAPQAQTEPGSPVASPESVPTDGDSPTATVEEYARRWSSGDYDGLYDLLSNSAQESIPRQDFIDRYNAITDRAGLTEVKIEITGQPNLQTEVPIKVTLQSSKVGEIVEDNSIALVKEDGVWKVNWTPSLIFKDLRSDGCVELETTDPGRGAILDRNGKALAKDGTVGLIGIVPGELGNASEESATVKALSQLIDLPEDRIRELYADAGDPSWFMPIKDVSEQDAEDMLDEIAELNGVRIQYVVGRVYPYGALAAHVTGYVSPVTADDIAADPSLEGQKYVARAGLEAGADELLAGVPGYRLTVVNCDSREERSEIGERKPTTPHDIVLTIDIDFQKEVDKALSDVQGNEQGSAVVLDPRTGAVLAMVSHPSFDPNGFILGMTDKEAERLNSDSLKPLLNRAAQAAYPTGSIFKVITMAAAMADLGYDENTQIDCPAQYVIPGTDVVVNDWVVEEGASAQGTLTLHQALVQSCNTVFYQIGHDLDEKDNQLLPDMAKAFGLGEATGIPYLPEANGTVPDPQWKLDTVGDYWATGDTINLAIGQGYLLATPLQMANAYAAIGNNGSLLQPFMVQYSQDPNGGNREEIGKRKGIRRLPITRDQISQIQSALRDQTSNTVGVGSSRVFADFPWPIAGKTGTAQRSVRERDKPHSWFAAFGPYGEKATIASIVMIENKGEGVSYAAPATKAIYEAYLKTDLMN